MIAAAQLTDKTPTLGCFVNGSFTRSRENNTLDVTDPATGEVTAHACIADSLDVDDAVQSAARAFHSGSWRRWSTRDRADVLTELADLVEDDQKRMAQIEAADTGLPIQLVERGHLPRVLDNLRFFAGQARNVTTAAIRHDEGFVNVISEEPLGVTGIVTPWNSPLSIVSLSLGAAIATGNACVIKPSELAPLSVSSLIAKVASLGLPPGVVNLVHGGPETGMDLVGHHKVDGISFTGSQSSGAAVMRIAGPRMARVTCELGGMASAIVLTGADVDAAVEGIMWSAFGANGSACLTSSVIYTHRDIFEAVASALAARVDALQVGDPLDPNTEVGPLISPQANLRLRHQRDRFLENGGTQLTRRHDLESEADNRFFAPTLIALPSKDMIENEDLAGPLTLVCAFDDGSDLCRTLNQQPSGLAAYVWGADDAATREVVGSLRFGSVALNAPVVRDARTPFGGFRASGLGRVGGQSWLSFWTETKSVTLRT